MNPSGVLGLFVSEYDKQQQMQYNNAQRAEQNRLNLQQWARENSYNSPSAQMARYADAGLNPNLIYGQSNTAAQSPTLVGGASMDFAPYGQMAQQSLLLGAQIDNIKADTENKRADAANKEENKNLLNEQCKLVAQEVRKLTEENNFYFNPIVREKIVSASSDINGSPDQVGDSVQKYVTNHFAEKFHKEFDFLHRQNLEKEEQVLILQVESYIKEQMLKYLEDEKNAQTLPQYFEALFNSPALQNDDTRAGQLMKLAAAALSGEESLLVQAQKELTKVNTDLQKLTKETLEVLPPDVRGALLIAQSVLSSLTDLANGASKFITKGKK